MKLRMAQIKVMLSCCILMLFACTSETTLKAQRQKININKGWLYLQEAVVDVETALRKTTWEAIDLPHSWNALDATDAKPGYRRSASWYKKTIEIPQLITQQNYQLYFEGVNIESEVYVNGTKVGGHVGGYIGFTIDITTAIKGGENEILVRVDNSYNPEVIPSQKSDFFIFGGITRDVWLETLPEAHLSNLKITTPTVSKLNAELLAEVTVGITDASPSLKVKATLLNTKGDTIATSVFDIIDGKSSIVFKTITYPELWHPKSPNLYTLDVALVDGEIVRDQISENVGFRWFEFKNHGAFYLNGERLLLRGTHRHEEHAGVGAAMSNAQHFADMKQIKAMGANFVRLAHYPQDPEVYKACNELGLLVWDELPWCRGGVGNANWKQHTKNMLKEMITQNYNHPSVIIWSLGNEIFWLPDFKDGNDTSKINAFLKTLNAYAHELDPSRKTAIRKYYEGADIVDVFSPSIWSGWYSGSYKSYQKAIDTYKALYPRFLHAEYGGSSHLGRHTETPITGEGKIKLEGWEEAIVQTNVANIAQIGDWSENYIVDLFDWHLRISENDSTFTGNIQWAFKDFGTPLRPENAIPYMNQKGLVDRAGHPKDAYYVFKSYWSTEPFTYIESHTWTTRQGPKDKKRTVSVYSNCPKVELFLNGNSLGVKQRNTQEFPASGLNWNLNFEEGANILIAKGLTTETNVSDTLKINYRFVKNTKATKLHLAYEKLTNGNYLLTATALDKNNLRCLDYEKRVYFQCLNGGVLLENLGTPTGSSTLEMANGQASIEVKRDSGHHEMQVMVLNQSFKGTYLTIK